MACLIHGKTVEAVRRDFRLFFAQPLFVGFGEIGRVEQRETRRDWMRAFSAFWRG